MAMFAAAAGVSIAGSIIGGIAGAKNAKDAAKAQKEQAKLQKESTIAEAEFTQRTTTEKVSRERDVALGQLALETGQQREKISLDLRQKTGTEELNAQQAEEAAKRNAFQIEAAIYSNRSLSAIQQANKSTKAALTAGEMRARLGASGVVLEGSTETYLKQGSILAELDRLQGAYESELGVRGLLIERGQAYAKSQDARNSAEYAKAQIAESFWYADKQITEGAVFSEKATKEAAAMTIRQQTEATALQKKYAEIGAKFSSKAAETQYKNALTSIIVGSVVGSASSAISGYSNYQYATNPNAFRAP